MKAWIVYCDDEWCTLMHADTRGKAINMARTWVDDGCEFIDFRARRFPEMDGKPFTYQDCKDNGFEYVDDCGRGEPLEEYEFTNDCHCDICRPEVAR